MPSSNDPATTVNPGPGKLPAGSVPAGAIVGGGGGGGGAFAALTAHITNPYNAHMASAIGVNPYYPPGVGPTPDPILTSVGGPVDGESVLDFIDEFKDLIPPHPNYLGFDNPVNITTGIPSFGLLDSLGIGSGTAVTGGWANGTTVQSTHYLVPTTSTSTTITGILFPADRGILALYHNTSGNFLDSSHTTLVAALWLGDTGFPAPPAGVPVSNFDENVRATQQVNYTASGVGLDLISLSFRYPYLQSYTGYTPPPVPYGPFPNNFYRFQLANFSITTQTVSVGDSQNWLLVHWNPNYATSLASIQPVHLTLGNLTEANCYSGVPTSNTNYATGSWDDNSGAAFNVNRHFVFLDSNSAASPVGTAFTSAPAGTLTVRHLSGIQYYFSTGLEFNMDIQATGLFANSFQTGSSSNPPNVPLQFASAFDPIQMDFTNFGGGLFPVPYYHMKDHATGLPYSPTLTGGHFGSPTPGSTGEYANTTLAIYTPVLFCPQGGIAQLTADLRTPFHETVYVDPNMYLFDTIVSGTLSTTTYEPFVDEYYRYSSAFNQTTSATIPILASGGNVFNPTAILSGGGNSLQVMGHALGYPQTDYNVATFFPNQSTDYSGFPAGDGANHIRQYVRAVDTGTARNTGWLRLRGLAQAAFTVNAAYDGGETTGHTTGGAIIQIAVPGPSGSDWLDIGRQLGDPGLIGPVGTTPWYGCQTGVIISGSDIYVSFQTGSIFTSNNTSGNFLLFVRVILLNGAGTSLVLQEFQWYPPGFVPP